MLNCPFKVAQCVTHRCDGRFGKKSWRNQGWCWLRCIGGECMGAAAAQETSTSLSCPSFDVQTPQNLRPGNQIFQLPVPKFSLSALLTSFWVGMNQWRGMSLTERDSPKGLRAAGSREAGEASWKCSAEKKVPLGRTFVGHQRSFVWLKMDLRPDPQLCCCLITVSPFTAPGYQPSRVGPK